MELAELQRLVASVGERRGWDFSRVRDARDPVPWDYAEVVRRYLRPTDHVLDVGTGGGERFLALAPYLGTGVGVDADPAMVRAAQENTPPELAGRVRFEVMDARALAFPDGSFDVVLNRHSTVIVSEVVRVLRPGGHFILQQVGGRNTQSVFDAFGWGSNAAFLAEVDRAEGLHQDLETLVPAFRAAGCRVVARAEYDVGYYFLDLESLIFWLKAAPLLEVFDPERHLAAVNRLLVAHTTPRGIATNEHRELLIVQKRR
jgi:SAM-dependent methyltransferase